MHLIYLSKHTILYVSISVYLLFGFRGKTYGQSNEIEHFYKSLNDARFNTFVSQDSSYWMNFITEKVSEIFKEDLEPNYILAKIKASDVVKALYYGGHRRKGVVFLKYAISDGLHMDQISSYRSADKEFNEILEIRRFARCLEKYEEFRKVYINSIDLDLQNQLTELYARDQFARDLSYDLLKGTTFENSSTKYVDSINLRDLANIFVENGNSFFKKAGHNSSYFLVLWHALSNCGSDQCGDTGCYDVINRFLKQAVLNGLYPNSTYAFVIDRANHLCGLPSVYGEYTKIVGGSYQDLKLIDERRAEIFLPPLWQDALIQGYALPKGYTIPEEGKQYFD